MERRNLGNIITAAGILAALSGAANAQTNFVTVTNYVTVTITNVVTVTNTTSAISTVATASTNHPAVVVLEKKSKWNQSVTAGLTLVRGNTDTTLMSAAYEGKKKTEDNEYSLTAGTGYGEQDSAETADYYKYSMQWNHFITKRLYNYLRSDGLRDYIADIKYRLTLGDGLGYYLLKETNTSLALEAGVNYEAQTLGSGQADNFATVRLADRFERKLNDHFRLWQTFEIFPEVDRVDNYVFNLEVGAETTVYKSLNLKTYFEDSYNNRPATAHLKNDAKLVTGVSYKF